MDYVTLFMDGAYGTRFVQFTHFFTNHYVHHARTSCKYIHVPTYLVLFHSLVQQWKCFLCFIMLNNASCHLAICCCYCSTVCFLCNTACSVQKRELNQCSIHSYRTYVLVENSRENIKFKLKIGYSIINYL